MNDFVGIPVRQIKNFVYWRCSTEVYFNNKNYKHVKLCKTPTRSEIVAKMVVFHVSVI